MTYSNRSGFLCSYGRREGQKVHRRRTRWKQKTGACSLDAATEDETRRIAAFHLSNNGYPYNNPAQGVKAIEQTMADALAKYDPIKDNKQTFLAGPYGSPTLLSIAINPNASGKNLETLLKGMATPTITRDVVNDLRALSASSLHIDFPQIKKSYALLSGLPLEPYADFFARLNLGSGLTSALKTVGRETTVRVPITSLRRIIKHSPQGRTISLICEAEGAELTMLYKDPRALMRMHQIAIEIHGPKITGKRETPEDMVDLLAALGFRREGIINSTHTCGKPSIALKSRLGRLRSAVSERRRICFG